MTPSQIRLAVLSSQYLNEDQKASRLSIHLKFLQSSLTLDEIEHGIVESAYSLDCFPVSGSGKLTVERVNGLYQLGSVGRPFRIQLVRTLIDLIGDGCNGFDQDMAQRRLADEDVGNGLQLYSEPLRVSFARWSNGDLKAPREISRLARNGAALSLGFRSTILAGDAEGVKHLLQNNKIAKRYGDSLHALFKDLHISTENPCFALLCEPSVDYCGYISSLLKMFGAGSGAQWRLLYRKEHSEKVGHEILVAAHAMSAKPRSGGDSFIKIFAEYSIHSEKSGAKRPL